MKKIKIEGLRKIRSGKREALIVREISRIEGMFSWNEWPTVGEDDLKDMSQQYDIGPADGYYCGENNEVFSIRPGLYKARIGA